MKFRVPNNFSLNIPNLAKKSGYFQIYDRIENKKSFVRKLSAERYPRFHLYISENQNEIVFDLHIDQTKARYENQSAHRGDYESERVRNELVRIYQIITKFKIQ